MSQKYVEVNTKELQPGNILSQNVYDSRGVLVFAKGHTLDANKINKLQYMQRYVLVLIESIDVYKIDKVLLENFTNSYSEAVNHVSKVFDEVLQCKIMKSTTARDLMNSFMSTCKTYEIIPLINCMENTNTYTQAHCLNVAALLMIYGYKKGAERYEIENLMLAGLLHDIGKLQIPSEILYAPRKLTRDEFRIIKRHPEFGYVMLNSYEELPREIKLCTLHHHVRRGGIGYPADVEYESISPVSKILAAADIFEALIADRPYSRRWDPFEAMNTVYMDSVHSGDPDIAMKFIRSVQSDYQGAVVKLSDGGVGKITCVIENPEGVGYPLLDINGQVQALKATSKLKITDVVGIGLS